MKTMTSPVTIPQGLWREVDYYYDFQDARHHVIIGVDTNLDKDGHLKAEQFKGPGMAVDYLMSNIRSSKAFKATLNDYLVLKIIQEFKN